MDFLKNAIGVGEMALGKDIVDEAEFVAGLKPGRGGNSPRPEGHQPVAEGVRRNQSCMKQLSE